MLADNTRNEAYREAFEKVVDASSRVLDVGTGSGLLAMIAGRAGAATVTGCEMSPAVAEAARQVIADNGYTERIAVVDKKSTALSIGEDMAQAANVLVSEIFDVGLLGEGVLPSLRHARRHLLTKDAIVIPRCATVFAKLVQLPRLRPVNPLREISGFDLSAFDRFRIPDDYLDIKLALESHRSLSEEFFVASFNFRDLPSFTSETSPIEHGIEVTVTQAGSVHAVAFWFELWLDEDIMLSTRPGDGLTAWGQAVQFLEEYAAVQAGERISLDVRLSDTRIEFHRKS